MKNIKRTQKIHKTDKNTKRNVFQGRLTLFPN